MKGLKSIILFSMLISSSYAAQGYRCFSTCAEIEGPQITSFVKLKEYGKTKTEAFSKLNEKCHDISYYGISALVRVVGANEAVRSQSSYWYYYDVVEESNITYEEDFPSSINCIRSRLPNPLIGGEKPLG